jgi:cytochrome oxidase Cu insertion factor (SCO1/SenC/PrrC family)
VSTSTSATPRPARPSWWVLGAAILVAGGCVGALIGVWRTSRSTHPSPAAASATPPPVTWAAGAKPAPDFHLVDQEGKPVSLAAYRGRTVIVTFLDPVCRHFCPLEARQLNDLTRSLPARSRPEIVAVSVNTRGNARSSLLRANRRWRVAPQWRWAVGAPYALASVWKRYAVGVQVVRRRISGRTVRDVSHTEAAYVIDRGGYERALFLWPFRAAGVRAALNRLGA